MLLRPKQLRARSGTFLVVITQLTGHSDRSCLLLLEFLREQALESARHLREEAAFAEAVVRVSHANDRRNNSSAASPKVLEALLDFTGPFRRS